MEEKKVRNMGSIDVAKKRAEMTMNKKPGLSLQEYRPKGRKYRRARISGILGDIADKKNVVSGVVSDISQGGFRLREVPQSARFTKHIYTAILSRNGKNFKMLVTPRWQKKTEGSEGTEVGFKIMDSSWDWIAFAQAHISETDYNFDSGFNA